MIITFFFSQPEILVCIVTKEKSYIGAKMTLEFRLWKPILLIKSNWEIRTSLCNPNRMRLWCAIIIPRHTLVARYCFPNIYPVRMSVRSSDMFRASKEQMPFNMSKALNLSFLCKLGSPSQSSSFRRKTCRAATVRYDSSIRTNRASV